jgi:hypothetical protein
MDGRRQRLTAETRASATLLLCGEVVHQQGVTRVPGLYVLGLAYQYRGSSHFIGGVGKDAEAFALRIVIECSR